MCSFLVFTLVFVVIGYMHIFSRQRKIRGEIAFFFGQVSDKTPFLVLLLWSSWELEVTNLASTVDQVSTHVDHCHERTCSLIQRPVNWYKWQNPTHTNHKKMGIQYLLTLFCSFRFSPLSCTVQNVRLYPFTATSTILCCPGLNISNLAMRYWTWIF